MNMGAPITGSRKRLCMELGMVMGHYSLMPYATVTLDRRGPIAHVILNRPDKLNALNLAMIDDLAAAATEIAAEPAIRAVRLSAAGRAFCAGADLTRDDFFADARRTPGANIAASLRQYFNPMVNVWHDLPVPIVVAVQGIAAGAGVSLALLGDLVVAGESAAFVELFAPKLGLMPDLGSTFFLPRLVGTARAKGLALLGDPLDAATAERWGLIWKCVPDAALTDTADGLAQRLSAGPTQAYARIKAAFNRQPLHTLAAELDAEASAQGALGDTQDFAAALAAFRAKRPPTFTGR